MLSRILQAPAQSFFLIGLRGSGKSPWLRITFPEAHVLDLLAEETYQRLLASPGLFAAELRALTADRWVIVDEVQRLPSAALYGSRQGSLAFNGTSGKTGDIVLDEERVDQGYRD